MTRKHTVRFRMEGLEYALQGEKSEEELQRIVDLVCRKVDAIKAVVPNYSAVRTSTLAALQLAEELLDARDESRQLLDEAASQNQSRPAPRKKRAPRKTAKTETAAAPAEEPAPAAEPAPETADVLFPEEGTK